MVVAHIAEFSLYITHSFVVVRVRRSFLEDFELRPGQSILFYTYAAATTLF